MEKSVECSRGHCHLFLAYTCRHKWADRDMLVREHEHFPKFDIGKKKTCCVLLPAKKKVRYFHLGFCFPFNWFGGIQEKCVYNFNTSM